MAAWTIQIGANPAVALSSLGVTVAERRDISLGVDTVELEIVNEDVFNTNDFTYLDSVAIFRDGTRWFSGTVTSTVKEGDGGSQGESITISGPWWWLTQIVFQQDWAVWDQDAINPGVSKLEPNSPRSRVLLGVDDLGSPITTGAQISSILTYAVNNSAPLTVGTISLGSLVSWTTEAENETCANIVRNLMAWHPDATTSFDYSASTPTLSIAVPSVVRSFAKGELSRLSYNPRPDLKVNGVVLIYERSHTQDGSSFPDPVRDEAGPQNNGPGVVVSTIPFEGRSRTKQKQRLKVRTIPTASSSLDGSNTDLEWWWQSKAKALFQIPGGSTVIPKTDFAIDGHRIELAEDLDGSGVPIPPPAPVNPNATALGAPASAADLPRELLDGSVEEWMDVKTGRLVVSAAIVYTGSDRDIASRFTETVVINGKAERVIEVAVEITGTDGTNKLYSKTVSTKAAETVPTGLAQAYYDSLQNIEHQGKAVVVDEDLAALGEVGEKIQITDGASTLVPSVAIQEVTRDIGKGKTSITFGPNERLSPQDFFEKLRMQRRVPKTRSSFKERDEGEGDEENVSIGPYASAKSNTTNLPPSTAHIKTGFKVTQEGEGVVHIEDGTLTENGDTEHTLTHGSFSAKTVGAGDEDVWALANTDKVGAITSVSVEFGPKPSGLQVHREEETDSLEDVGQDGKYAWKILTLSNSGGKVSWVRHLTGIQYYSDRSAKNWTSPIDFNDDGNGVTSTDGGITLIDDRPMPPKTFTAPKEVTPPTSGTKYKTRCVDSSGNTGWADTDAVPASEYPPDVNAAAHIADQANPHNVGADQVGESATRKWFTPAEQTKLTGIESGATADQTGPEIKTAYESQANTNAFTDSEQGKLASIDATHYGSPVQSTTALAAISGPTDKQRRYVEDELSDYFFDSTATSGDVAPNSGSGYWKQVAMGGETSTSIKTKYESNANTNAFTDTEQAKLSSLDAAHATRLDNPHAVTKAQVGLGSVDNTSDLNKPISTLTQTALDSKASTSALTAHIADATNPHSVTKAQVGLGNADNTNDASKPVSSPQQAALDLKADSAHTHTGTEIETWYNSQVPEITAGEITAATETEIRRVSPKLLKDFVDLHGGAGATSGLSAHIADTANPHSVTKTQVGLSNVDNTSDLDKPISTLIQSALNGKANSSALTTHIVDIANPHGVTKAQVGLGNADNTSDLDKPISALTQSALNGKANSSALIAHISDVANPHTVTKAQVGLGSVDDTSDLDKPISTLVQAALDGKVSTSVLTAHTGNTTNPHSVTKAQVGLGNANDTSDLDKPISTLTQSALNGKLNTSTFTAHSANTNNPHNTNATDVGLGNANNTSDLAKPISTLTQAALDNKASTSTLTAHINDSDPHGLSVLTNPPNSSIVKNLQVVNGVISWV